ncbi:MAG: hypothetical protein HC811_00370 [Flammeovirgaceae bacterium]|nr:hypothetical protein [Flammeovirgaceae bacterium]
MNKDKEFRSILYSFVEEAFDGEHNVLFKHLMEETKNPTHARMLGNKLVGEKLDILNAFSNIKGKNYYPQIFIPFYDELKAKGKLSTKDPVLVVYTIDSQNSIYQGYSLDTDGNLIETQDVSEAFAKENEVWVVSLNERVDNEGNVTEGYKSNIRDRAQGASYPNARFCNHKD